MLIIIAIAAKVIGRPFRFHKWGVVKGCTYRTGDPILTSEVFHAICLTQFKASGSQGSGSLCPWQPSEEDCPPCPACNPDPDSDPCIAEGSSCLLLCPVQDFLVLPGSCSQDSSALAPSSGKISVGFVYFAEFALFLLVLLVKLF